MSIRSLIKLALKTGKKTNDEIVEFVSKHPKCRASEKSVKVRLNQMVGTNEVEFLPKMNKYKLRGYPIDTSKVRGFATN